MRKIALTVAVLALGLAACDNDDDVNRVPADNEVVVNDANDVDRAHDAVREDCPDNQRPCR